MRRTASRGFTLVEVMAALAILSMGLIMLLKATAHTARRAESTRMLSAATMLGRGKMYDVEEQLRKDGFQQMSDVGLPENEGTFEDEGWPNIHWKIDIREITMPSPEKLEAMAQQQAQAATAGSGSGTGSGTGTGSSSTGETSGLFGMLSMIGGGAGSGSGGAVSQEDMNGAGFLGGGGFNIVQEVFKASIRKLVLTISWTAMGEDDHFDIVEYLTDADAMNKVIGNASGASSDDYAGENTTQNQNSQNGQNNQKTPSDTKTPNPRGGK